MGRYICKVTFSLIVVVKGISLLGCQSINKPSNEASEKDTDSESGNEVEMSPGHGDSGSSPGQDTEQGATELQEPQHDDEVTLRDTENDTFSEGEGDTADDSDSDIEVDSENDSSSDTDTAISDYSINLVTLSSYPNKTEPDLPTIRSSSKIVQMSVSHWHMCVLKSDASVVCWEGNDYGKAMAPAGEFTAIDTGEDVSCGLTTDGKVVCWGRTDILNLPAEGQGLYTKISVGDAHVCAIRKDGKLDCWGVYPGLECAKVSSLGVVCPPEPDLSPTIVTPPDLTFSEVSSSRYHTCGITTEGALRCWGKFEDKLPCWLSGGGQDCAMPDVFSGTFTQVDANSSCALKSDGSILCWDVKKTGASSGATIKINIIHIIGSFVQLSGTYWGACFIDSDGALLCSGKNDRNRLEWQSVPPGRYSQVEVGLLSSCALESQSGEMICWRGYMKIPSPGYPEVFDNCIRTSQDAPFKCVDASIVDDFSRIPQGEYTQLLDEDSQICGLQADGVVNCWDWSLRETVVHEGPFSELVSENDIFCGISESGAHQCWGGNYVQADVPNADFKQLSFGYNHVCGIESDGSISCWGGDECGILDAPQGRFIDIDSDGCNHCAVDETGKLICWGRDYADHPAPSLENVTQIAMGSDTCALMEDGSLHCWDNYISSPDHTPITDIPAGEFVQVEMSEWQGGGCALRNDGVLICWGFPYNDGYWYLETSDSYGFAFPGTYSFFEVSDNVFCGTNSNGETFCTSIESYHKYTPPDDSL